MSGIDTPANRQLVLQALPGTMLDVYDRTGLHRNHLIGLMQAMKWDGLVHRVDDTWQAGAKRNINPRNEFALPCPPGGKGKKLAVVLVAVPGWPAADPGRVMEFSRHDTGQEAVRMAQKMRALYPGMKWTAARMRSGSLAALVNERIQPDHPGRAPGPAIDAAVPAWIQEL